MLIGVRFAVLNLPHIQLRLLPNEIKSKLAASVADGNLTDSIWERRNWHLSSFECQL